MIKKCSISMSLIFVNIFRDTVLSTQSKFHEIISPNDQKDMPLSNLANLKKPKMQLEYSMDSK